MPPNSAVPSPDSSNVLRYGLVLFPQFEVLDVFGPIEALNTIVRLDGTQFPYKDKLSLVILAETLDPVSSGPIKQDPKPFNLNVAQSVVPTHTFDDAPDVDVLLVPGGFGTGPKTASGFEPDVSGAVKYIERVFHKIQYLITVCTGATLAAQAHALDDRAATTNKSAWQSITATGPKTYWVAHARWVVSADKKVWTTSGVSAGTDGFLAFLDYVYGKDQDGKPTGVVDAVCASMEYTRAVSATDDPWAIVHQVTDVPPQAWP